MKYNSARRARRRSAPATEAASFRKESSREHPFFSAPSGESFFQPDTAVQRKCDTCEKDEQKVQKKEAGTLSAPGRSIGNYISSLNGSGSTLPAQANHFFSSKMGYDFSNVKIHNDKEAADSANAIHAKAYTIGNHVVFNEGQYNSGSEDGKKLLAHELSHVMQQDKHDGVKRKSDHSFWFNDPDKQKKEEDDRKIERERVFIEPQLTHVGEALTIRFAYPSTKMSTEPAEDIKKAKEKIANSLAGIISDLSALPPAKDKAERIKDEQIRARLKETLSSTGPINIFIQTDPSPAELVKGVVAAWSARIFVSLADVGDDKKLQAAISVPLIMLTGGVMPAGGKAAGIPAATDTELKDTLLHESLHGLLMKRSIDAEDIHQATAKTRKITGDKTIVESFELLLRNFMVAQEEIFVYTQIAELYTGGSPEKATYETFNKNVMIFIKKRNMTLNSLSKKIDVAEKVNKKKVDWTIVFLVPEGTVDVKASDKSEIDFLNGTFPH